VNRPPGPQRRKYLEEILHELKAINAWDRAFFLAEEPDPIEFAAWKARRWRVFEILRELLFAESKSGASAVN
jgi:hypothetical protein